MKNTPMTELAHTIQETEFIPMMYRAQVMQIITQSFIEKEKQVTIDAYEAGDKNGSERVYYNSDRDDKSGEQYYNKTFNK